MFEDKDKNAMTTMEWIALTALCTAMTVPFLVIMQDMAESLRIIADKR